MIVGAWSWAPYEEAFSRALTAHGVNVTAFRTKEFFNGFLGRQQDALPILSPALLNLNWDLVRATHLLKPQAVLFWRPTQILPRTLRAIVRQGITTISYNNDDPFGPEAHGNAPWHHRFLWHWYKRCLPLFDINFFYRGINREEALARGAQNAQVLLPYFLPWQDRPLILNEKTDSHFRTDVVFAGHYEADGREIYIQRLLEEGIALKIWGGKYWTRQVLGPYYRQIQPIEPAQGDDYTRALCGAKICLAFLSKINRDTYTRRCFEIPACGRLMLAERTAELQSLFREDKEACYFSSPEELVEKVHWLLANPVERERIANAGLQRVWAGKHDVYSRARFFLDALKI